MRHRTALLVAGLLASLGLLAPAADHPTPPAGIPTPAMPAGLIPCTPPPVDGTPACIVVPPLPSSLIVPPCSNCGSGDECDGPKVCAARWEVVKSSRPVYSTREVAYCYPRSCLGAIFHHGDCEANCTGTPRTKKVLVKRLVPEEKEVCKCVPMARPPEAPCAACPAEVPPAAPVIASTLPLISPAVPATPTPLPKATHLPVDVPAPTTPEPAAPVPAETPVPQASRIPSDGLMQVSGVLLPPLR